MKKEILLKSLIGGFIIAVLFSFMGFDSSCENLEGKVLRLHVRANSDSDMDQEIKLLVKDKVFTTATELTRDCTSCEDASRVLSGNMDILLSCANECLESLGAPYKAKVSLDDEFFSTREYEDFTLPAGDYRALRIDLGEGKGENWWCAVYPSLCTASSVKYDSFTQNEENIITSTDGSYVVRFKLYELYRKFVRLVA